MVHTGKQNTEVTSVEESTE